MSDIKVKDTFGQDIEISDIDQTNFQSVGPRLDPTRNTVVEPFQGRNFVNGVEQDKRFKLGTYTETIRDYWETQTFNRNKNQSQFEENKFKTAWSFAEKKILGTREEGYQLFISCDEQDWSVDTFVYVEDSNGTTPLCFYYDEELHPYEYQKTSEGKVALRIELREDGRNSPFREKHALDNFQFREIKRPFVINFNQQITLNGDGLAGGYAIGDGLYAINDDVLIQGVANQYTYFKRWTEGTDDQTVSENNPYSFQMPRSDQEFISHFVRNPTITLNTSVDGDQIQNAGYVNITAKEDYSNTNQAHSALNSNPAEYLTFNVFENGIYTERLNGLRDAGQIQFMRSNIKPLPAHTVGLDIITDSPKYSLESITLNGVALDTDQINVSREEIDERTTNLVRAYFNLQESENYPLNEELGLPFLQINANFTILFYSWRNLNYHIKAQIRGSRGSLTKEQKLKERLRTGHGVFSIDNLAGDGLIANQENETGEKTLNTKLELNAVPDDGYRFLPFSSLDYYENQEDVNYANKTNPQKFQKWQYKDGIDFFSELVYNPNGLNLVPIFGTEDEQEYEDIIQNDPHNGGPIQNSDSFKIISSNENHTDIRCTFAQIGTYITASVVPNDDGLPSAPLNIEIVGENDSDWINQNATDDTRLPNIKMFKGDRMITLKINRVQDDLQTLPVLEEIKIYKGVMNSDNFLSGIAGSNPDYIYETNRYLRHVGDESGNVSIVDKSLFQDFNVFDLNSVVVNMWNPDKTGTAYRPGAMVDSGHIKRDTENSPASNPTNVSTMQFFPINPSGESTSKLETWIYSPLWELGFDPIEVEQFGFDTVTDGNSRFRPERFIKYIEFRFSSNYLLDPYRGVFTLIFEDYILDQVGTRVYRNFYLNGENPVLTLDQIINRFKIRFSNQPITPLALEPNQSYSNMNMVTNPEMYASLTSYNIDLFGPAGDQDDDQDASTGIKPIAYSQLIEDITGVPFNTGSYYGQTFPVENLDVNIISNGIMDQGSDRSYLIGFDDETNQATVGTAFSDGDNIIRFPLNYIQNDPFDDPDYADVQEFTHTLQLDEFNKPIIEVFFGIPPAGQTINNSECEPFKLGTISGVTQEPTDPPEGFFPPTRANAEAYSGVDHPNFVNQHNTYVSSNSSYGGPANGATRGGGMYIKTQHVADQQGSDAPNGPFYWDITWIINQELQDSDGNDVFDRKIGATNGTWEWNGNSWVLDENVTISDEDDDFNAFLDFICSYWDTNSTTSVTSLPHEMDLLNMSYWYPDANLQGEYVPYAFLPSANQKGAVKQYAEAVIALQENMKVEHIGDDPFLTIDLTSPNNLLDTAESLSVRMANTGIFTFGPNGDSPQFPLGNVSRLTLLHRLFNKILSTPYLQRKPLTTPGPLINGAPSTPYDGQVFFNQTNGVDEDGKRTGTMFNFPLIIKPKISVHVACFRLRIKNEFNVGFRMATTYPMGIDIIPTDYPQDDTPGLADFSYTNYIEYGTNVNHGDYQDFYIPKNPTVFYELFGGGTGGEPGFTIQIRRPGVNPSTTEWAGANMEQFNANVYSMSPYEEGSIGTASETYTWFITGAGTANSLLAVNWAPTSGDGGSGGGNTNIDPPEGNMPVVKVVAYNSSGLEAEGHTVIGPDAVNLTETHIYSYEPPVGQSNIVEEWQVVNCSILGNANGQTVTIRFDTDTNEQTPFIAARISGP